MPIRSRFVTTNCLYSALRQKVAETNALGNLKLVNYPSSPDLTFQHDWLNRLTNLADATGATKYTYTSGSQLLTEDGPFASDTVTDGY